MGEIRRFQQPEHDIVPPSNFEKKMVILNSGVEKIKINNKNKSAGVINPFTLKTKENYEQPIAPKSEQFGHLAEFWLAEDLKELPGVKDVLLADNITDSGKKDLTLVFRGGIEVPLQITTNPNAIKRKIEEAGKDTVVIYVNKDDFEKPKENTIPALTKKAIQHIADLVFKGIPKQSLEELMAYHQL